MPEASRKNDMPLYLGLDTSNYTTSAALFDSAGGEIKQSKKLLPVKRGELGLRQSDAVFHHVGQISEVINGLNLSGTEHIKALGASCRPRNVDGSYMPCFLVGESVASSIGTVTGRPVYKTSHQVGHILAALYSCGRLDLIKSDKPFLAFHVSGGTTDCLLVKRDGESVISAFQVSGSLDIKAGQLIDRIGLMLGLKFPCGIELEKLAVNSTAQFKIKPTLKNGSCCLSGVENKCSDMLSHGVLSCDIALYALKYIEAAINEMTRFALSKYSDMPVIYAGGVMSDMLIRKSLQTDFDAYFCEPCFSCDNAAGIAVFAAIKDGAYL